MILDTQTKQIEVLLGANHTTNQLPCMSYYVDHTSTTMVPGSIDGPTVDPASVLIIVTHPGAASTYRQVKGITVFNADTVSTTVTVQLNDNGTIYRLVKVVLPVDNTLVYQQDYGWTIINSNQGLAQVPASRNTAISTTLTTADYLVNVTDTTAVRTMTIASGAVATIGRTFCISDTSGGAGLTPILLTRAGAETFQNGATTIACVTSAYGRCEVISNGTNWICDEY